jgi:ATP-dependent protease ClpP protease subunit
MILNLMSKKRTYDFVANPTLLKAKKKIGKCIVSKKNKDNGDEVNSGDDGDGDDGDEESNPLVLPNLFKQEDDHLIYLKHNHLYFHTEVSEDSVDQIKKLMRQYWSKISNIKKMHSCGVFEPKPLYLHIFSPGGCVYSGLSLYDFVLEYKKKIPVYTVVEGMAASAATFISIAGTKRYITPNSYMLIHQLSTMIGGNFEQVQDGYDNSKKSMEKIMHIYKTHTKINKKKIPNILKHDLNWDAQECLSYGLVDEIKLIDIFNDDNNLDNLENF